MRRIDNQENGAALLSVLLVVAFMSVAALALMEMSVGGIQNAKAADWRSRANWQIIGAEQAGLAGIIRIWEGTNGELRDGIPGFREDFIFEANGAQLSSRLEEAGNCFNLNALLQESEEEPDVELGLDGNLGVITPERNYRVLLETAGLPEDEAERLANTLLDWMDADNTQRTAGAEDGYYSSLKPPYLSSGTQLAELSELRTIRGYTKKITDQISPLLCVRAERDMSVFNINTLTPDQSALLSMAFSGELNIEDARDIILNRPIGGWGSIEEMFEDRRIERISPDVRQSSLLSTRSQYLALQGQVAGSQQSLVFSTLYNVEDNVPPRIVARAIGGM